MPIENECHEGQYTDPNYTNFDRKAVPTGIEWSSASCGVSTVYGIERPGPFVRRVFSTVNERIKRKDRGALEAFVLFSDRDVDYGSFGAAVAKYLKAHPELGPLIETEPKINPNSGHKIKAWIWAPAHNSEAKYRWVAEYDANHGSTGK